MMKRPDPLSCGCVRGFHQCPEAVALWAAETAAYEEAKQKGNWDKYEQAGRAHDAHFKEKQDES